MNFPWPFVRKRTYVAGVQFWREQLAHEERLHRNTRAAWERERGEWFAVLDKLSGHWEDGVQVMVDGAGETNFQRYSVVRRRDLDTTTFLVDVSGYLVKRFRSLDQRDMRFVADLLAGRFSMQLLAKFLNEGVTA